MSLFDVDKNSDNRTLPTPNHTDQVDDGAVMAKQTLSTTHVTDASSVNTRIAFKNNLILYYDDQNRIIRVDGFIPSVAAYPVTIIAKYGFDVYKDILGITAPS